MFETMSYANGVGLAAPQIGKSLRIFVLDSTPMKTSEELIKSGLRQAFINPEIIEEHGEKWPFEEGVFEYSRYQGRCYACINIKVTFFDEN